MRELPLAATIRTLLLAVKFQNILTTHHIISPYLAMEAAVRQAYRADNHLGGQMARTQDGIHLLTGFVLAVYMGRLAVRTTTCQPTKHYMLGVEPHRVHEAILSMKCRSTGTVRLSQRVMVDGRSVATMSGTAQVSRTHRV